MTQDNSGVYKLYSFLKGSIDESNKYGKADEGCKKHKKTKKKKKKTKESKVEEKTVNEVFDSQEIIIIKKLYDEGVQKGYGDNLDDMMDHIYFAMPEESFRTPEQTHRKGAYKELEKIVKGLMGLDESVVREGTWALPKTDDEIAKFNEIMKEPLLAKDAADVLYGVLGDDGLFDELDRLADSDPDKDVRGLVKDTYNELKEMPAREAVEEDTENVSSVKQVLFTYAHDGYWVKEADDDKKFIGGEKDILEYGVPKEIADKAKANSGIWVDVLAEKTIKEEDEYSEEEIDNMFDFALPGAEDDAKAKEIKDKLVKYDLYDYKWHNGYHYFVFQNREDMLKAGNFIRNTYGDVVEAKIKIGEKVYKLGIRRENG